MSTRQGYFQSSQFHDLTPEEFAKRYFGAVAPINFPSNATVPPPGPCDHQARTKKMSKIKPDWKVELEKLEKEVEDFEELDEEDVEEELPAVRQSYPTQLDLRLKGEVNAIKEQRFCGSCWAHAAIASLESCAKRRYNLLLNLSEQLLVGCTYPNNRDGCNGGWTSEALDYMNREFATSKQRSITPSTDRRIKTLVVQILIQFHTLVNIRAACGHPTLNEN